jgi:ribosomal protein S18 acetylase RimI-like enzyme
MKREILQARQADLRKIANCHRKAFPDTLTSKMGDTFLIKMFDWYLSTNHTFLFFTEQSNTVVGYCGGMIVDGTFAHGSASSMTQHTFNEAIRAFLLRPWLLLHPDFLSRYSFFARNIFVRFKNKISKKEIRSAAKPRDPYMGLVVIGVDPLFQGKGYGSCLLIEFEKTTLQRGLKKMLLTVNTDNRPAIKSYLRNGWVVYKVDGKSTSMEKRLN